jgi:hypothetical protein
MERIYVILDACPSKAEHRKLEGHINEIMIMEKLIAGTQIQNYLQNLIQIEPIDHE